MALQMPERAGFAMHFALLHVFRFHAYDRPRACRFRQMEISFNQGAE